MGGSYREVQTPGGCTLVPAGDAAPDLVVPECDYVLTIDADSVILLEYCLQLVHFLEREENNRVNVVSWLYKPQRHQPAPARSGPRPADDPEGELGDWGLALYLGFAERRRSPRRSPTAEPVDLDRAPLALPVSAPVVDPGELGADLSSPEPA